MTDLINPNFAKLLILFAFIAFPLGLYFGLQTGFSQTDFEETQAVIVEKTRKLRSGGAKKNRTSKRGENQGRTLYMSVVYEAENLENSTLSAGKIYMGAESKDVTNPSMTQWIAPVLGNTDRVLRKTAQIRVSDKIYSASEVKDGIKIFYRKSKPHIADFNPGKTRMKSIGLVLASLLALFVGALAMRAHRREMNAE